MGELATRPYDSRDARSLGPEPTGADLIQLVNQVIDYAIAGLAAPTATPAPTR